MSNSDREPRGVPPGPAQPSAAEFRITDDSTEQPTAHQSVIARIRNYFLTGLILVGPLYITFSLTWWFINWMDDIVRPFIPDAYRPETYLPFHLPGLGLIIVFCTLTLLGFLTANLVGRKLIEFGEHILSRTPIIRPIYRSLKQIFETLFSKSGSTFRRVGLVEFPAPGMWSVVFISQPASGDVADKLPEFRPHLGFSALHAQSDDGLLLLPAAARRDRARHHGRSRHDAGDVGRDGAAERDRPAAKTGRAGSCRPCGTLGTGAANGAFGTADRVREVTLIIAAVSASTALVIVPSPPAGEGCSNSSTMNDGVRGLLRQKHVLRKTPHPFELADMSALPSPARRGEGANTSTATCGQTASSRPDEPDRLVALKQIEQMAQRFATRRRQRWVARQD